MGVSSDGAYKGTEKKWRQYRTLGSFKIVGDKREDGVIATGELLSAVELMDQEVNKRSFYI